MAGVNKATIVGNLGNDPEIRSLPNGDLVATLSVATSETWTDKNTGERKETVQWHRIVFYRKQAEICQQYLKRGSKVYVEGSIQYRKWEDPETHETKYSTEIRGSLLQMLDSRPKDSSGIPDNVVDTMVDSEMPFQV